MKTDALKKKAPIQLLAGFGMMCLFLSACATLPNPHAAANDSAPLALTSAASTSLASTPIQQVYVQNDYITASSFQDLARKTPLIVIGQVTEIGEVINAGLDLNEDKPSTYYYDVGQIYKFQVEEFLKGQGDLADNATLNILVFEGIFIDAPAASVTQADIDQQRARRGCDPRCQPMVPGTRYLLFLKSSDGYPPEKQYYSVSIHPWMFPLTNPNYVQAQTDWSSVNQYFPGQPLADIIWQIENPDVPYVRPTPTEGISRTIPVQPAYPYPKP
jgi:hypothetical protein